ncbi:hypothetical protein A1O7_02720 [Cladophialophora yegresii CBS 114405]|uniref:Uncharacterized protein n=1 Tax=Cladophialophora yegresii CBS 114405 TaxID=1182544 RepID=W9W2K1_9EURO|nr:uncharacterized protein A1O7_02720 [Cladophialophora yegresii CBS 114405]EXJ62287.1 hypothetical protein A1O7_02720 [Cladophialophora yegresii CBS 114405]
MPSVRGFNVTVEGTDGTPFTTYGTRSRGKIVYTSIEARDGARFQIRVTPDFPFPEPKDAMVGGEQQSNSRHGVESSNAQNAMDCDEPDGKPEIPYEFFASVYIDGNSESEDNSQIPTEAGEQHYRSKGHVFKGRCCGAVMEQDAFGGSDYGSGMLAKYLVLPWVFRQKGIDVLLSHMNISETEADIPTTDLEADLADVTEAMANDGLSKPTGRKPGQIEIVITREVTVKMVRPKKYAKPEDTVHLDNDECNTHEVTVDANNKRHMHLTTVKTRPYRADEQFFCKVCISYCDIAKLRKLGLCTQDGSPTDRRLLAISSSPESPGPLKRLRDYESGRHEVRTDDPMLSDGEESTSSDSTSDSDVPRRNKRRGAITSRRSKARPAKPRRNNHTLSWTARKDHESTNQNLRAAHASSTSLVLPEFHFDLNDEVSGWVRELHAEFGRLGATDNKPQLALTSAEPEDVPTGTGDMKLITVSNETVELSDEVDTMHEE